MGTGPSPEELRVAVEPDDSGPFVNRLARARSPYLLQHARNPVDWYPWGEEAFARAVELDRPVFLSIGYSACHWCHVMERESFEDARVAALLNRHFLSIKVDREEHPAVDAFYMDALVHMTGEGGWPASLWLTPERVPFQAGTYFPPYPRYGLPSFRQTLERIVHQWTHNRSAISRSAGQTRALLEAEVGPKAEAQPREVAARDEVELGAAAFIEAYDWTSGGWGPQARFPQVPRLQLLLTLGAEPGDPLGQRCAQVVRHYLDKLDRSGIHDHVGGGFHRYAVDPDWDVPHFEKMLYDNALLARAFLWGAQLTGERRFATVCATTLEYLLDELRREDGAFGASQDAEDVHGDEGGTYTWTPAQLRAVLGPVRARAVSEAYGVSEHGNFENGGTVLKRSGDASVLAGARRKLLAARRLRPQPATDSKAVVAWNGMALAAFAEAGRLLGDPRYLQAARELGRLLWDARDPETGAMPRTLGRHPIPGVLDDQAHVAEGLLALYEATGAAWALDGAAQLGRLILREYQDPASGAFCQSPHHATDLPLRRVSWIDGAEPAPAGVALQVLVRLQALGSPGIESAEIGAAVAAARGAWGDQPAMSPSVLSALVGWEGLPWTLVISGDSPEDRAPLAKAARRAWAPWRVVAEGGDGLDVYAAIAGKQARGARVWICEGAACRLPIGSVDKLREALGAASS